MARKISAGARVRLSEAIKHVIFAGCQIPCGLRDEVRSDHCFNHFLFEKLTPERDALAAP